MPKYTTPVTLASSTLINASTWNDYLGSRGNLQWAYNELENISGGRFIMMKQGANLSAGVANTLGFVTDYTEAYGEIDYANLLTGTIQTPMHAGYVWASASINHTIGNVLSATYAPNLLISIIDSEYATSFVTRASTMYTSQGYTNTSSPATGTNVLAPLIRSLSVSAIIPVYGGPKRLRVGINRVDGSFLTNAITVNHFTVIPLADVSGLANFIDNVDRIIE